MYFSAFYKHLFNFYIIENKFNLVTDQICHEYMIFYLQEDKKKMIEDKRDKMLAERAKFIERTRNILQFDHMEEDKPRKSGKVQHATMLHILRYLKQNTLSMLPYTWHIRGF